ncbi:MAG: acyl carrier protein [Woronichinia naegeliana WA131]|jgi:acyl carrier protein|uniref:Acyl carrier protein n=1 Tax=Woronichinia naegeliana WA131 TaxID=2824559 RepID=A0A977KVU4_9CYAN|nr:MAG: acyl carrier protein [Woronichinia naegeliana WA131]
MTTAAPKQDVTERVITIIDDMTQDWDLPSDEPISATTQLMDDLAFESVDVVQLIVALEENFKNPSAEARLPFEKLIMIDGRYVDDLSIDEIAEFLVSQSVA